MLVKFIYHFPPVLLLHSLELRGVCLPWEGGRGGKREGDLGQDQVKEKREAPALGQGPWRRGPKAGGQGGGEDSACAPGNMYVWVWVCVCEVCTYVCVCMRVMCMCMCVCIWEYIRVYVYVGVAKNVCVCFLSHALSPCDLDTLPDPQD